MKQALLKRGLLAFFLLLPIQCAFSQGVDLQNYVVTKWGLQEGLPQSSVNDIIQTEDGYIWLATFGGLVRFDGNSFTTFNRSNTPGMISDRFLRIFADSDGGIWMFSPAPNTIVSRFKEGKSTTYVLNEEVSTLVDIFEDEQGVIWLTAFSKTYRFNGERFEEVSIRKDPESIRKAKSSAKGTWFGYGKKIFRTIGDSVVEVYGTLPGIESDIIKTYAHPDDNKKLLVGTRSEGLLEIKLNKDELDYNIYTLPYEPFLGLRFDDQSNFYALTPNGIAVKKDSVFLPLKPFDDSGIRVKTILQDNEGNYWIGTGGDGLFRFRKKIISMIDKDHGLTNEKMLSVTKLNNGSLMLSTNCSGIFDWKDGKASLSTIHKYLGVGCYWSVFQDSKERIWIGGSAPYMTESLDKPGKTFGKEDGYDGFSVFAIAEDSDGNIWVATANGIFIYNGTSFTRKITKEDGLYYSDARVLFEDESGVMWVGTNGGLNTIEQDLISKIELLPASENGIPRQPEVRAIYKDEDKALWIGTYGDGLFRIKDGEVSHLTTEDGLFDNVSSHIVEDKEGYFWIGSNQGIYRVNRQELNQVIEGEVETVKSYSYGSADGMNSPETNGGFQPSTIVDSLGNIYFPTVAGVAVVATNEVKINQRPPPVYIERIRTSEKEASLGDVITLPYDDAYLEINYTGINFSDPDKVHFKYRMQGLDDTWIDAGNRREALYTKIPPGEYTFQVRASNNNRVWNTKSASFQVTVIPPFWQKIWFYGLLAFFLMVSAVSFYKQRTKKLKKENERQKRFTEQLINFQENERRRIAAELHDGLGQQILVIKNRVELAQKSINNAKEIEEQLDEIMQSAVSSIHDVRTISYGLRPVLLEKFGLTDAITNFLEQLQNTSSVEWSFHIDDIDKCIPQEKEIHFYRVLQEGTNNILKHASANEASAIIKRTKKHIEATLWDDGKGFNLNMTNTFGGMGFLGMKERMETLGGTLKVQSTVGEGTQLNFLIPIQDG